MFAFERDREEAHDDLEGGEYVSDPDHPYGGYHRTGGTWPGKRTRTEMLVRRLPTGSGMPVNDEVARPFRVVHRPAPR